MTGRAKFTRTAATAVAAVAALATTASAASLGHVTRFGHGLQDNSLPGQIVAGPDGNLWFADPGSTIQGTGEGPSPTTVGDAGVGRVTPQGEITEFFDGMQAQNASDPRSITAGPDGALWFTDDGDGTEAPDDADDRADDSSTPTPAIGRIATTGAVTEFMTGLPKGSVPGDITAGPDGNLWFTDQGKTRAIGTITPAGQITEFTAGLAPTAVPGPIAKGADGNLWFTDAGPTPAIGRISTAGQITEFPLHLGAHQHPLDIAAGPDGNLWFTVHAGNSFAFGPTPTGAIGRITPAGDVKLFTIGLPISADPFDIAAGPDGALWFTDSSDIAAGIGRITTGGQVTEIDGALAFAADSDPAGVSTGPDGNVWVTNDGDDETYAHGVGVEIDRVDSAGASATLTQPKFVLTCRTKKYAGSWHCRTGLAGHTTLARATGPVYRAAIAENPEFGHGPLLSGTGRRVGSRLVITVSRQLHDDLIETNPILALTHGHTRIHVRLVVDCIACNAQD